MKHTCDCIIPFYNENLCPLYVVEEILKIKSISKIITVDDGSDNNKAYLELKTKFPLITAVRLEQNSGKTNAIREGLKRSVSQYVFLADGDLENIKPFEIENAIQKIMNQSGIDMIILPLVDNVLNGDWFRWYTIFSGQRILKTDDLRTICQTPISGFQLEAGINQYMIQKNKKTFWTPSSLSHRSKYQKWGKIGGVKKVISLIKELTSYFGWRNLILQTLFFCRFQAP